MGRNEETAFRQKGQDGEAVPSRIVSAHTGQVRCPQGIRADCACLSIQIPHSAPAIPPETAEDEDDDEGAKEVEVDVEVVL